MDNREALVTHLEELIAVHGQAVIGIWPDQPRGLPALNYSIGLQDHSLPEIVLTGVLHQTAVPIINAIADWLKARGSAPAEAEILPDGFIGDGFHARFRQLSKLEVEENLIMAVFRSSQSGRDAPEAFQIVYQDPQGRWPEEDGYSCALSLLLAQSQKETRQ
jgi:hypothetical protein